MSAFPPIATVLRTSLEVRFVPTTDSCTAAKLIVDHLDGLREQRERHGEAERLGGLHVDHQLELGRQLNRKIGRLCALENLVDIAACTNKQIGYIGAV